MGKKNLTFGDIETEKNKSYRHKNSIFLEGVDSAIVLVSHKIFSCTKTINTLLATCIMIIKLSH